MKNENDNFIMLPIVDFCFKELMQNPKVRKGVYIQILSALGKSVELSLQKNISGAYGRKKYRRNSERI